MIVITEDISTIRSELQKYIDTINPELRNLNKFIHDNPETAYKEHKAHDSICDFLDSKGFTVTRHAFDVETSFKAEFGHGGRVVSFNAEYDALPGIGHGCGHNLIATSSITGFLSLAFLIKKYSIPGRAVLFGTPAEEGGGGKVRLINAGAYKGIDVSLMGHGFPGNGITGTAGARSLACHHMTVTYTGRTAHAAANPQDGINALDAAVLAYTNASLLRQQLDSNKRLHGIISNGGQAPNVIPEKSELIYAVRATTLADLKVLIGKIKKCFYAAAEATGCQCEITADEPYADLRVYPSICKKYANHLSHYGMMIEAVSEKPMMASTDQGNVSYEVPQLHSSFSIPTIANCSIHHRDFADAAGKDEAHEIAIKIGQGLGLTGWDVLTDEKFYREIQMDWKTDLELRKNGK